MINEPDIQNSRILIVDDEKANASMLELVLKKEGFSNIQTTTSPVESVEIYKETRPDLVLLDLRMPVMDGFEVLEAFYRIEGKSYPPVIVLTAESDHSVRLKALQAGAKDFLSKPLDLTEVLYRCRNLLEMRLLHNQLAKERDLLEERVEERTQDLLRANQTLMNEITERRSAQNRIKRQNLLLEMIARETSLEKCMDWIRLEGEPLSETAVALWLRSEKGVWRCPYSWNLSPEFLASTIDYLNGSGDTAVHQALQTGQPVIVTDNLSPDDSSGYSGLVARSGFASDWYLPLRSGDGSSLGVFSWYFDRSHKPSYNEEGWLSVAGNLIGLVVERTRSLARLQRMNEQLIHSEKLSAIGKLSASLSHEFNNPIMGIRNVLEQIGKEPGLDTSLRELAQLAVNECSRVMRLTTRLREFYRPSDGNQEKVDLVYAIEDMILLKNNEFVAKGVQIERRFDPDVPPVRVVEDQIKQVLLNLLQNAGEAVESKTGRVTIILRVEGDQVAIRMRDNGPGISPDHLDQIFDPFFTTKTEDVKGTGLGLSVSYGIVKKHGGTIGFENLEEGGCEFYCLLPVDTVSD